MSIFGNMGQTGSGIYGALSSVGQALNPYSARLIASGLGMMGGGPSQALQGFVAGSQIDQTAADKRKQLQQEKARLDALHRMLLDKSGPMSDLSPAAADYIANTPDAGSSVIAARLLPKADSYQATSDGRVFNTATGQFSDNGQANNSGNFYGGSVEAQALNRMIAGGVPLQKAAEWAGGKLYQDPSTGQMHFMTIKDWMAANGGQAGGGSQQAPAPQQPGAPAAPALPAPNGQQQGELVPQSGVGTTLTAPKPNKVKSQGQVKGEVLIANAESDYQQAAKLFDALGSKIDQAAGLLPGGRALQSGDYQVAVDSVKNVVQSYIYAVSGAQAPDTEVARMMTLVLPSVTDKPQNKAVKKARLDHMMEAIRTAAREGDAAPASPASDGGGGGGVGGTTSSGVQWSVSP